MKLYKLKKMLVYADSIGYQKLIKKYYISCLYCSKDNCYTCYLKSSFKPIKNWPYYNKKVL